MSALGELVTFTNGGTPPRSQAEFWDGDIPWITGADISATGSVTPRAFISNEAVRRSSTQVLPAGTVLLLTRTAVGKVGVLPSAMAINQDITGVTPSDEIDSRYLVWFLRANAASLAGKARGATIKGVTRGDVASLSLELPPPAEQQRIAAILDRADAIRTKRRQVLGHLDALTQSIFRDMFGDLATSSWQRVPFGELIPRVENGASPSCESRPATENEWGVLKLGAVTYGTFRSNENKAFLGDTRGMVTNEVRRGDVLMTRKNTRELVGAVALVDDVRPRLLMPDLIFRLHLDRSRLDPQYFQALMMSPQKRPSVRDLSSGSASSMPNISKARLAGLQIEVPPLALQRAFAFNVDRVNIQRAKVQSALVADGELFASLQSRAFQGKL